MGGGQQKGSENLSRLSDLVEKLKKNPPSAEEQVRWTREALRSDGGDPLKVLLKITAIFEPELMLKFLKSYPATA